MHNLTEQASKWSGAFGREYTERNPQSIEEMEELYTRNYGLTRTELNRRFLDNLDRSIRILEVGSNVGNQLLCLQRMGFDCLYGIELQSYAVEIAKSKSKNINIIQGEASDIPFKDSFFDMVFTSGVLIHISPKKLPDVLEEIHRCTKKYIFGFEYYSDETKEIPYRGNSDLLWKADFAEKYLELFDDLTLVKEERIKYLGNDNVDTMFLLKKELLI
ncbi:MAG: methyltransferase domain-containing protein [Methanothrix sp.]|nr:methyltransferase domain-containing protein [Methanothrix sp.]